MSAFQMWLKLMNFIFVNSKISTKLYFFRALILFSTNDANSEQLIPIENCAYKKNYRNAINFCSKDFK